jgi:hypothetical protein
LGEEAIRRLVFNYGTACPAVLRFANLVHAFELAAVSTEDAREAYLIADEEDHSLNEINHSDCRHLGRGTGHPASTVLATLEHRPGL